MSEENLNMEPDLIDITDDEGHTETMQIIDYFFYNGQEYAIIGDYDPDMPAAEDIDSVDCFIMKVNTITDEHGEEFDEFEPIEDEDLENRLIAIASQRLNEDEEADEEE